MYNENKVIEVTTDKKLNFIRKKSKSWKFMRLSCIISMNTENPKIMNMEE